MSGDIPDPKPARQIAHLDLDGFLIAVERTRDASLRARPVIIGGRPDGRGVVAAVSVEARDAGVTSGMPLTTAAVRCPQAAFLEGAFQHYFQASQAVDAIVRRHCGLVEWIALDEAYLDLTGRTAADARRACADLQSEIADGLGVDVAIGMASSKVVARVASRLARPRGLLYVLPGYEARLLAPLRVAALPGLDRSATDALQAAGIHTLGELAALDTTRAAALMGRCGPVLVRHAGAVDAQAVLGTTVPKAVVDGADVGPEPADGSDAVVHALEAAVTRAAQRLRSQGLLARTTTLTVRYADGTDATRGVSLRDPSSADDELVPATRRLLARIRRSQPALTRVDVSLGGLERPDRQLPLFRGRLHSTLPSRRRA